MSLVLEKAAKLIELVAHGNESLSSLATEAGLSKSTAHRILATLVAKDYLSFEERRYKVGYKFLEFGELKRRNFAFVDKLRPITERWVKETNDTMHLALLDGTEMVLIERQTGTRQLQIASYIGQKNPALMTAVGKALVSLQPPHAWGRYLEDIPSNYSKKKRDIEFELYAAAQNRYAIDIDECSIGTCGIASTFKTDDGRDVAVSINGATVYFKDNRLKKMAPVIKKIASEMGTLLRSN